MKQHAQKMSDSEQQRIVATMAKRFSAEDDLVIRQQMVQTLGYFRSPGALDILQKAMNDPDPDLRVEACQALGRHETSRAMQLLVERQRSDTNVDVRIAATRQLGRFKDAQAIQALGEALDDSDPAIQFLAMDALRQSTGENLNNDVRQWKQLVRNTIGTSPNTRTGVADRNETFLR